MARYASLSPIESSKGLPRPGDLEGSTIECINQYEKTSSVFHVIRYGIKQKQGEYRFASSTHFKIRSFLIRTFSMIGFFRLLTLMLVTDESVHIYLGDALYGSKQASIIYFLCIITLGSLYGFGEITLYQESSGHWKPMRVLDKLRSPNLNPSSIGLSRSYLTKACSLIHVFAKHGIRIMNSAPVYMIAIIEAPIIAELSLKENPMFNFYCILWSFCLACPFIYHMAGNFGRAGYLIMFGICSLLRLRSLESLVKHSSSQLLLIERDINSLVSTIIRFCNEMEENIRNIRLCIFYAVFVIAFMADVQLFFGVIITLEPALVSHLLAINAAVILFALGITVYFCGVYLNTVNDVSSCT